MSDKISDLKSGLVGSDFFCVLFSKGRISFIKFKILSKLKLVVVCGSG